MSYKIYLVSDSRGAFLQKYLDQFNQWPNIVYVVKVYRGRGVMELWKLARNFLLHNKADFVYILEGTCSLTTWFTIKGKPEFWLKKRPRDQIFDLCLLLNNICDEAVQLHFYARISFIQELGCDLIRYNRIAVPAVWMLQQQSDLEEWLPTLHNATKEVDYKLGVRTPWAIDAIYKHDASRKFYPRFHI